jgi:hypothetical protein
LIDDPEELEDLSKSKNTNFASEMKEELNVEIALANQEI